METRQSFSDVLVPGVVELALASGRTPGAVRLIASKLDCQNRTSPRWTTEENDITRKHYAKGAGFAFIMALLKGRTAPAIFARSDVLGVASGRFWREEEIQILKEHYPVTGGGVVDMFSGRTVGSVRIITGRMGFENRKTVLRDFVPEAMRSGDCLRKICI
ncbi:hypothetical protein ACU6ZM_23685 [Klebsiella aerogenes]